MKRAAATPRPSWASPPRPCAETPSSSSRGRVLARAGGDAMLYDADRDQCRRVGPLIEAALADLAAHGVLDDPAGAAARVRVVPDLVEAVGRADFVQENLPETVEAKAAIFRELDRLAPKHIVLASS